MHTLYSVKALLTSAQISVIAVFLYSSKNKVTLHDFSQKPTVSFFIVSCTYPYVHLHTHSCVCSAEKVCNITHNDGWCRKGSFKETVHMYNQIQQQYSSSVLPGQDSGQCCWSNWEQAVAKEDLVLCAIVKNDKHSQIIKIYSIQCKFECSKFIFICRYILKNKI